MPTDITLDDTDARIQFSSDWTVLHGSSDDYQSTLHASRTIGASASISWSGVGAKIFGTMPIGPGSTEVHWQYSIDGGAPVPQDRHVHDIEYHGDVMLDTGSLSDGLHTLVIQNTGTDNDLRLDRWVLTVDDESQPWDTPVHPPPPSRPASNTKTKSGSPPAAPPVSATSTHSPSLSSHTSTITGTNVSSISQSETSSFPITTNDDTQIKQYPTIFTPTSSGTPNHHETDGQSGRDPLPLGVILGLALGGLVILLLVVVIIVLSRRRRLSASSSHPHDIQGWDETAGTGKESSSNWFARRKKNAGLSITPFNTVSINRPNVGSRIVGSSAEKGEPPHPFQRLPDAEETLGTSSSLMARAPGTRKSNHRSSSSVQRAERTQTSVESHSSDNVTSQASSPTQSREPGTSLDTHALAPHNHPVVSTFASGPPVGDTEEAPPAYPGPQRRSMMQGSTSRTESRP